MNQNTAKNNQPAIVWFSDPVRPDETVMLQGESFSADSVVELFKHPDQDGDIVKSAIFESATSWQSVSPIHIGEQILYFVIPADWAMGAYACRVRTADGVSKPVLLNAPDCWWMQGNLGMDASAGGWLRLFGKSLNFGGVSRVALRSSDGAAKRIIPAVKADCYALSANLPQDLPCGEYQVLAHNGHVWREAGSFTIRSEVRWKEDIFNVVDFGAMPYDVDKDSTSAVNAAIQRAADNGGGVVYFPRGRYKITGVLNIPPYSTLKGEGMGLVNLFWPDMPAPLTSLIWGKHSFAVEDLALYAQGSHYNVITGEDNVRVQRVRIRAYAMFEMYKPDEVRKGRKIDVEPSGSGLYLTGKNIVATDCDILHTNVGIYIHRPEGALVARNRLHGNCSYMSAHCVRSMIFEENESTDGGCGVDLFSGSWGLNIYDANACQHLYFAHNTLRRYYRVDREILTLDGQGTAYVGRIRSAQGSEVTLAADPQWRATGRAGVADWKGSMNRYLKCYKETSPGSDLLVLEQNPPNKGLTLFIVAGRGTGQYRRLVGCEGRKLLLERPWEVAPDETSVVSLARFNGRHLIVGNTFEDAGACQLYAPNYECIVAENQSRRTSGYSSCGWLNYDEKTWGGLTADFSWHNQFLDNRNIEGNGWGGNRASYDGYPGGGLLVYAHNTEPDYPFPVSCGQVIRRHVMENNSAIRIMGAIKGVLVEKCWLKNNPHGIVVEKSNPSFLKPSDPTFLKPSDVQAPHKDVPGVSCPVDVLLLKNTFENIDLPCSGSAAKAVINK